MIWIIVLIFVLCSSVFIVFWRNFNYRNIKFPLPLLYIIFSTSIFKIYSFAIVSVLSFCSQLLFRQWLFCFVLHNLVFISKMVLFFHCWWAYINRHFWDLAVTRVARPIYVYVCVCVCVCVCTLVWIKIKSLPSLSAPSKAFSFRNGYDIVVTALKNPISQVTHTVYLVRYYRIP